MKLAYTILYVADVEASVDFYEKAFGFARKFVTPERDYGELSTGATTLAFASHELGGANFPRGYRRSLLDDPPFGVELAMTSEHIEEDWRRAVEAGAQVVVEIQHKPWGQQVGYVRDIDGFLIEICTPIPPQG